MSARFLACLNGLLGLTAALVTALGGPSIAAACGCFSPPVPPPDSSNYAVNQQAEQIIFEVNEEDGTVTAHVMILYQGDPAQFGWLLPAPNVPQLDLSEEFAFAIIDEMTRPQVSVALDNACPAPEFDCRFRGSCPIDDGFFGDGPGRAGSDGGASDAGADAGAVGGEPPVTILSRETVGDYETIVFEAGDTALAVQWLNDEGFIVNETTAPFMQPYADAGMVFVAAKLVAGADIDSIKPLKMTYRGDYPMIPLRITAVAAEPELTVTAFIYADEPYGPKGRHIVQINEDWISDDGTGRTNYPMALSRAVDNGGGDGFVVEFAGVPPLFSDTGGCCGSFDACGLGGNGACECPGSEFDALDCEDQLPGFELVSELATRHFYMTRVTTRLSPHEMTFDPMYEPRSTIRSGRLALTGTRTTVDFCRDEVATDEGRARVAELEAIQLCASTYCGEGECVVTDGGAGCACNEGFVARAFSDLDGARSVTCVPADNPVDLSAGGLDIKSSCDDIDCGSGTCVDQVGFPSCACDDGFGAVIGTPAPTCLAITARSGDAGANGNYGRELHDVDICWPMPPTCGPNGWLVRTSVSEDRRGVACGYNEPTAEQLEPLPPLDCGRSADRFTGGGGCSAGGAGGGVLALIGLALFGLRRRR